MRMKYFLEQAGWYENREIDVIYMIDDFERLGYHLPNDLIKSILSEFGNLRIELKSAKGISFDLRINPEVGMEFVDAIDLSGVETLVGDLLLPIGSVSNDHGGLLISYSGKLYLMGDTGIYFLGNNFVESCENILADKPLLKVGGDPSLND